MLGDCAPFRLPFFFMNFLLCVNFTVTVVIILRIYSALVAGREGAHLICLIVYPRAPTTRRGRRMKDTQAPGREAPGAT